MSDAGVGLREILRVRGFRLLLGSRLAGQTGDGFVDASLATFVLFSPQRQPTALAMAVSFSILLLPYSLIGPFVGVFLDRWSRRAVLVWANLLRTLLLVELAWVLGSGRADWLLAVSVLVVLGVNRFILAALSAGLPHVVEGRYLVTGNALAPTAGTIAGVLGGLVGILVRGAVGGGDHGSVVIVCCAMVMYVLASAIASRLAPGALGPDADTGHETFRGVAAAMVDGLRHLRERRPAARAIGLVVDHRIVFGMGLAVTVLQARSLHPDDADLAIVVLTVATATAGLGAFLGALSTPFAARAFGAVRWSALALVVGVVLGSLAFFLYSDLGQLLAAFFIGFAGQSVKVCSDTIVQEDVDDDRRGRVFALYDMAVNVSICLGAVVAAVVLPTSGEGSAVPLLMMAIAVLGAWWALTTERRDPARGYAADPVAIPSDD